MDAEITAFVVGVAIPLIAALFGREALGKWLLAGQARETTALDALVGILKESIAGWRESSTAISHLAMGLEVSKVDADAVRARIFEAQENQYKILHSLEERLTTLLLILANQPQEEL